MITVGIVVLNWNNIPDTIACLDSLLALRHGASVTLLCCDNGSTDDSAASLLAWGRSHFTATPDTGVAVDSKSECLRFVLLRSESNRGYAGGNNLALRHGLQIGGFDFFWLLNNDTYVEPDALQALLDCAAGSPPERMIWGSTLVHYDQPSVVQCAGGLRYLPALTITRPISAEQPLEATLESDEIERLDAIAGAAMFIRGEALRTVGLLNDELYLYYEELDYAVRLRRHGHTLGWCRHSVVHHKRAASTGGRSTRNSRGSRLAHYHENLSTLRFTARHYPWLLPIAALCRLLLKGAAIVVHRRWHEIVPLLAAYRDFALGRSIANRNDTPMRILFHGRRGISAYSATTNHA